MIKLVSKSIATAINNGKHPQTRPIFFVKAGEKPNTQPRAKTGILATATDWQLKVDMGKQLWFTKHITPTALNPDMVIFSDATKQVVMVKLKVPWEERMGKHTKGGLPSTKTWWCSVRDNAGMLAASP